jgi:hypothetical protein
VGATGIETLVPMDEREAADVRYRLRSIPRVPIASVPPDAIVKVRGYVSTEEPLLTAPVTGKACALYSLEWSELLGAPLQELAGRNLVLDDGTGRALVRIDRARISLLGTWMLAQAHRGPPRVIECREALVEEGALVTVLGHASYEADPGVPGRGRHALNPYRAAHGRNVFAASDASPLYIVRELIVSLDAVG